MASPERSESQTELLVQPPDEYPAEETLTSASSSSSSKQRDSKSRKRKSTARASLSPENLSEAARLANTEPLLSVQTTEPTPLPTRRYVTTNEATAPTSSAPAAELGWDEDDVADLKHYLAQVYAIIRPVILCIIFVVWWVKVDQAASQLASNGNNYVFGLGVTLYSDPNTATAGQIASQAIVNALIIVSVLIAVTILFVVLFYYGFHKFLYGYLMFSTAAAYVVTAGLLIWDQTVALNVSIDYLTVAFCLWNFAVVGLCCIFWYGPLFVQQFYLIAISALVAWALTQIDQWTTWVLLGLLVIWDLVAVLTPCGPLRVLVESSQRQNVQIPALLYSVTMIYFMADPGDSFERKSAENSRQSFVEKFKNDADLANNEVEANVTSLVDIANGSDVSLISQREQQQPQPEEEDDEERSGLKLGLGDFVFYSVLVARAALNDWTSLFACIVAVLFGLTATILLLAIYRRALPALPISLTIGILFYFVTSLVVTPFVIDLALYNIHI